MWSCDSYCLMSARRDLQELPWPSEGVQLFASEHCTVSFFCFRPGPNSYLWLRTSLLQSGAFDKHKDYFHFLVFLEKGYKVKKKQIKFHLLSSTDIKLLCQIAVEVSEYLMPVSVVLLSQTSNSSQIAWGMDHALICTIPPPSLA